MKSRWCRRSFKLKSTQTWLAMAGVLVMSLVAVAGFAIAIYAAWLFHDLPSGNEIADYRPATSTRVFAWDGTLIGEYAKERRIFVPYERIPQRQVQAFLAAEDRNFFSHSGVDVSGIGRAIAKDVVNLVRGKRFEGGSTITQQVARDVLLNSSERTVGRKLKEIILARRLEASLTKQQILELYLNGIFLGYRSNGVGTAAFNYFGKSVEDLSLSEMAYLATLPKSPTNYHPTRHKEAAMDRRNWVLGEMFRAGWITNAEMKKAQAEDLVVQTNPERAKYKDADYFVSEVERRAKAVTNNIGTDIYSGGYYIKTTLQPKLQTAGRIALQNGLEEYDRRHGWRGAWGHIEAGPDWTKQAISVYQALPQGRKIPAERNKWQIAVVRHGGKVAEIATMVGATGTLANEDIAWSSANAGLKDGDLIYVEAKDTGGYRLKQVPAVNGALVAIDPWSGRVVAMVGGYSFSLSNFNRATQAKRQPGSSIKPFVYAAALEKDFTPASIVVDGPISFTGTDGKVWEPHNYEHDYIGPATLRKGLELSRNAMTVRLAQGSGMKYIAEKVVSYGAYDSMLPVLAMALGAGETTPFKLAGAYSAFPNGGRKITPHLIEYMEDREGKPVYQADRRTCPATCSQSFDGLESPRLQVDGKPVLDPIVAYQVTSFLEGVIQRGTAVRALVLNRPLAGKTGTTNEFRSAWFMGFTTDLVIGVFVGFDDNHSLGEGETGAHAALPIFIDFLQLIGNELPKKPFPKPKDAVFVSVRGISEAFRPGTEPKGPVFDSSFGNSRGKVSGPKPYDSLWHDTSLPDNAMPSESPPEPPQ